MLPATRSFSANLRYETGFLRSIIFPTLGGKRLELLRAMAPSVRVVGLLVNPRFGAETVERQRQAQAVAIAAKELGRELVVESDDGCRD
jgi:hypothetical protein